MSAKLKIQFDMHLRVAADRISTILDTLAGSCEILKIEQYTGTDASSPTRRNFTYENGKRDKGISADNLLIESLAEGPRTRDQVEKAFVERGFKASSLSPSLSKALALKTITFDRKSNIISKA